MIQLLERSVDDLQSGTEREGSASKWVHQLRIILYRLLNRNYIYTPHLLSYQSGETLKIPQVHDNP
jgi:hypothetical protein